MSTCSFGAKTVFTVCTLLKIEIVIDKVGINLHKDGKEDAEEEGRELRNNRCGQSTRGNKCADGKSSTDKDWSNGSRQRLGTGSKKPSMKRIGVYHHYQKIAQHVSRLFVFSFPILNGQRVVGVEHGTKATTLIIFIATIVVITIIIIVYTHTFTLAVDGLSHILVAILIGE